MDRAFAQSWPVVRVYAAIGGALAGAKDILGLWAGTGGEGATFKMSVLTEIKNYGVTNTFTLASKKDWDALKRALKPINAAPTIDAARAALDDLLEIYAK